MDEPHEGGHVDPYTLSQKVDALIQQLAALADRYNLMQQQADDHTRQHAIEGARPSHDMRQMWDQINAITTDTTERLDRLSARTLATENAIKELTPWEAPR